MQVSIRRAVKSDVGDMVELSKIKRLAYEKAQPQFWRYAGEAGDIKQAEWFETLLENEEYIMLTAEDHHQKIIAFIIGRMISAPEVYNPGGLTLMVDDFCVSANNLWNDIGSKLINNITAEAKTMGVSQILVVCGAHSSS